MKVLNVIKGWISSLIGILVLLATLLLVFASAIPFIWEGIAGFVMGTILLYTPRSIEKFVEKWLGINKPEITKTEEKQEGGDV